MKIHLKNLELYIGDNGKIKYRHKGKVKALCGKNDHARVKGAAYTVEIPRWYEHKAEIPGELCQHCVEALAKKKRELRR